MAFVYGLCNIVGSLLFLFLPRTSEAPVPTNILDDPNDETVAPIGIVIRRRGKVLGNDFGAAWIEDGNLYFSGSACSFCINGRDVLTRHEAIRRDLLSLDLIPLRTPDGSMVFEITYVGGQHELVFKRRLREFKELRPEGKHPSTYPPGIRRPVANKMKGLHA